MNTPTEYQHEDWRAVKAGEGWDVLDADGVKVSSWAHMGPALLEALYSGYRVGYERGLKRGKILKVLELCKTLGLTPDVEEVE